MQKQKFKRSFINNEIKKSLEFFKQHNFHLPKWATWSIKDWNEHKDEVKDIITDGLGWDITDFNKGDFCNLGIILFTIRNGKSTKDKPYCEKIIIIDENQHCPLHFHFIKVEDIINRSGGELQFQLYHSTENGELSKEDVKISIDGIWKTLKPGEILSLQPGESISIPSGMYHSFWGLNGKGKVLVGEVSKINDDKTDNRFYEELPRFSNIDEDEEPFALLVNDYSTYLS